MVKFGCNVFSKFLSFIHVSSVDRVLLLLAEEEREARALRPEDIEPPRELEPIDPEPVDPDSAWQDDGVPVFEPQPSAIQQTPVSSESLSQTSSGQFIARSVQQPPAPLPLSQTSSHDEPAAPQRPSSETASSPTIPLNTAPAPDRALAPTVLRTSGSNRDHSLFEGAPSHDATRGTTGDTVVGDIDMTGWPASLTKIYRYLVRESWGSEWQATVQSFAQWEFSSKGPVSLNEIHCPFALL